MHAFLSYSAADRKFAERLREELRRHGLSVWADSSLEPGSEWRQRIEDAIRSADDILILVGPRSSDDANQQLTWRIALEAVWQDSRKRLIPLLLRDAAPPPFVFGDASGDETPIIRILNPRDLRGTAKAILLALQNPQELGSKLRDLGVSLVRRMRDATAPPVELDTKGTQSFAIEGERSDRLLEIRQLAERLKR